MIQIDRRYLICFDWVSFFLIIVLSIIGLLTVLSATYNPQIPFSLYYKKQLFGIITGIFFYCMCCLIDYKTGERWGYFLYFATLGLLMLTFITGIVAKGGQRWISLGFFKFQPSELTKIFFAPYAAYYLSTEKQPYAFSTFVPLLGMLGFSSILILKQPDLGTALVLLFSGMTLLWLAGLSKKFFITCACVALICAPIAWTGLKPYQKQRVMVFLGEGDQKKERYQIEQSMIAIGSGGLIGKGYLKGTQTKLSFLPEGRTDCIFSVFCEEWGFIGALVLIMLYGALFYRAFRRILSFKNFYAQLLASGLLLPLLVSTIINLCMVMGLMPIVGIPLPFMTYGMSHLWMSYINLGLLQSIIMRRFAMTTAP